MGFSDQILVYTAQMRRTMTEPFLGVVPQMQIHHPDVGLQQTSVICLHLLYREILRDRYTYMAYAFLLFRQLITVQKSLEK